MRSSERNRPSRRTPTQRERLRLGFELEGVRGLEPTQWLAPGVYDGGSPILNFAGRVAELRAAGHQIEARGRRNGCRVLILVAEPTRTPSGDPVPAEPEAEVPEVPVLFEASRPAPRSAIFGGEQ